MADTILTILLFIVLIEVIINTYLWNRQKEIVEDLTEDCNNFIDTELELESIILSAKANKELPFVTVEKIEKVLFPDNKQVK